MFDTPARMAPVLLAVALGAACVKRDPLPPLSGSTGPEAPLAFTLPRYPSGEPHSLASDLGNVVLLDVWATWCEPCRDALPTYEQLLEEYGPRGLRAYAINVDLDQREIPKFLQETPFEIPILLDRNGAVAERTLRVSMMPTTFLLDRKGKVRFVHQGFAEEMLGRYQSQIEQLLAEPSE